MTQYLILGEWNIFLRVLVQFDDKKSHFLILGTVQHVKNACNFSFRGFVMYFGLDDVIVVMNLWILFNLIAFYRLRCRNLRFKSVEEWNFLLVFGSTAARGRWKHVESSKVLFQDFLYNEFPQNLHIFDFSNVKFVFFQNQRLLT